MEGSELQGPSAEPRLIVTAALISAVLGLGGAQFSATPAPSIQFRRGRFEQRSAGLDGAQRNPASPRRQLAIPALTRTLDYPIVPVTKLIPRARARLYR